MIQIENTQVLGWEAAIRGMRNPMNSWDKSDSSFEDVFEDRYALKNYYMKEADVGPNDLDLMLRLANGGPVHAKYRRMIAVYVDITAPLYWWKEFDTYRVGVAPNPTDIEMNSCSTMHKIQAKEFTLEDFSHEHLDIRTRPLLEEIIKTLNDYREWYVNYDPDELEIKGCPPRKLLWWQMIQLLPTSYNQKRTVMLNYEVLANIYQHRRNHKLDEWRELCQWIDGLPYSEIITCGAGKESV